MRSILMVVMLVVVGLLLGACEDDFDRSDECGLEGNCCWSDNTCNPGLGLICKNGKCVKGTAPTPDTGPTADTTPAGDKGTGDLSGADATSDATPVDAKPADAKPADATPDKAAPDTSATPDASTGG